MHDLWLDKKIDHQFLIIDKSRYNLVKSIPVQMQVLWEGLWHRCDRVSIAYW